MLYHIRLQYGFQVEARNRDEAFTKAVRAMREQPGSHIASVEQFGAPRRGNTSIIKRLVTGK